MGMKDERKKQCNKCIYKVVKYYTNNEGDEDRVLHCRLFTKDKGKVKYEYCRNISTKELCNKYIKATLLNKIKFVFHLI